MNSICQFCEENAGKYTCPRCNCFYCSVACYRSPKHVECSEAFYKECIDQEMKVREPDPETREKMIEILKKNYEDMESESDSQDSDDDINLVERLKDIDLDDTEQVWSKLTSEEQKEFLELATAGDISKLVPVWEPWWTNTLRHSKVRFADDEANYKSNCPKVKNNILALSNISKSTPSPLVFNNLINVIAAYAIISRFMNGEHNNSPHESTSLLLDVCKNLSNNVVYDTLELAIESVATESINNLVIAATTENISIMKNDVAYIALGPTKEDTSYYILACLSDVSVLITQAIKCPQQHCLPQIKKTALPAIFEKKIELNFTKKQLMLAEKKVQYYLSWVTSCYSDIINELGPVLEQAYPTIA